MTRKLTGWLLGVVTVVVVLVNQRDVGIARDESTYIHAGASYAAWWRGLVTFDHGPSRDSITTTFGGGNGSTSNTEHPPLIKTAIGMSEWLLHEKLGLDELASDRVPGALCAGLLVLLVYLMVLAIWGFPEAVLAGLFVMLLPRALFHESIACFDAPITTLWFATVYAYWRALDGRNWPWQVGVVFGLALATKHTAVLLPFALIVHYVVVAIRAAPRPRRVKDVVLFRPRVALSMLVLSPLVLVALWPWLWFDTLGHIQSWLSFHANHVHYNYEYLGENWNHPRFPWHVALVTTLFTIPVATLAAAAVGAGVWIARWKRGESVDRARAPVMLL
ncbi:MAG TPA: glycosyltransferase family 39 protein, partial [Kofleriaceae bacterium]|nr:glycosyltransferase family 39 protein [Kofleriaceae bacterium]